MFGNMQNATNGSGDEYNALLVEVERLKKENEQLRISARGNSERTNQHESVKEEEIRNKGGTINGTESRAGLLDKKVITLTNELSEYKKENASLKEENMSLKEENEMLMEEIRTQIGKKEGEMAVTEGNQDENTALNGTDHKRARSKDDDESANGKKARILELKDNPVSRYRWTNEKMVELLRSENDDLLNGVLAEYKKVPLSSYERLKSDIEIEKRKVAKTAKMMQRLKDKYNQGIKRFVEIVYKVLGYKLEFVTEWRIRIIPRLAKECSVCLDMSDINDVRMNRRNIQRLDDGQGGKIVENLMKFWIIDKRELSCFFSSLNLELYERKRENNVD